VILYKLFELLQEVLVLENKKPPPFVVPTDEEAEKKMKVLLAKAKELEAELNLELSILKNKEENLKFASQKLKETIKREVILHQKKVDQLTSQLKDTRQKLDELKSQKPEPSPAEIQVENTERLKELQAEIQKIKTLIPNDLFNNFKLAFELHPSNPFTAALKPSNTCSSCSFRLTLEEISLLISEDKYFNCPACKRLVVKVEEVLD
jgi:predicted  nucleic acid-binding Zn-ribbon protein